MQTTSHKFWYVYILLCQDNSLYTGITDDLQRRLEQHKSGKGSKYTKARGAEEIVYFLQYEDRSSASVREHEIKKLSRAEKLKLISSSGKSI